MTFDSQDQRLEAYLPVYDAVPDAWENAKPFLVENFKRISNAVNTRSIGYYLDQELLSGKQFIPGTNDNQQFRSVLRKVVNMGSISIGVNTVAHGITNDSSTSDIMLWVSATNSGTLTWGTYVAPEVEIVGADIIFTSPKAYDRAFAFLEYIQET